MNNLFTYLLELNMAMVIFYAGYKLFFEKDRNFLVRRLYLLATIIVPVWLILLPDTARSITDRMIPVAIHLDQITVTAYGQTYGAGGSLSPWAWLLILYLSVTSLGMTRLFIQLARIMHAVRRSERLELDGINLYANPGLHASSFFGYIFVDPARAGQESFNHILDHEQIHRREWHSADRILAELFLIVNWFNPVAWLLRRSVIENLEYHTDSEMVKQGTDPRHYQLSILNQYIGSASLFNQFNSQIKNRINMLNRNYKLGSAWKLAMIFPMVFITLFFFSCTDKENMIPAGDENQEQSVLESEVLFDENQEHSEPESDLFYIVEEMPKFQDEDPVQSFRQYLAQNLKYPEIAAENGISGRVIVQFTVNKTGQVVDAVAVRSVDPALDKEAIRVVMSSPKWTPGKQHGKTVNVLYTFPVNFALQ